MKERNGKGAKRGKEKEKKHVLTASLNPIFSKVPAKDTGDVFFFFLWQVSGGTKLKADVTH